MQVTPSSSALFCGLTGASNQAPTPSEPQGPAMGLAGPDMAAAAPSTLVGYNKPLQVNDDALTRMGHNRPLLLNATASATAGSTATPPKADTMEIAALELLLAEPANQDMVQHFGGPLQPLPTGTDTGQGIQARYGADLGARLNQLQTAQQTVREEYHKAWENAAKGYGGPDQPGWLYTPEIKPQHADDSGVPARWDFDPVTFTQHYASGGSPAQKAFAQLHGSEPLYFKPSLQDYEIPGDYVRNGERGQYVLDDPLQPTFRLSATDDTELVNKENLWFDPVHGWSTDEDNLKGDWIDKLSPVLMGGFLAFCTGGALSSVMGVAPGSMTVAQSAAIGASSSAVIQLVTTGKLDFGNMLRSALTAGMATGIMDASGMGDMLKAQDLGTRMTAHLGKAGMQGVLQQAIGGKFKDGFANSLLSSAASEVGAHLNQQIKAQLPELDPAQASALKLLGRAATSALRIAGGNDPAASFANDFLMGALQDAAVRGKPGQEGRDGQEGAQKPGTAQGGEMPSQDWVERLGRSEVSVMSEQTVNELAQRQLHAENVGGNAEIETDDLSITNPFSRRLYDDANIRIELARKLDLDVDTIRLSKTVYVDPMGGLWKDLHDTETIISSENSAVTNHDTLNKYSGYDLSTQEGMKNFVVDVSLAKKLNMLPPEDMVATAQTIASVYFGESGSFAQTAKNILRTNDKILSDRFHTNTGRILTYQTLNQNLGTNIDSSALMRFEGGQALDGYVPQAGGKVLGRSGVTIATGFDIGQMNEKQLSALGLPKELEDKLRPYTGLTKQESVDYLLNNPLSINRGEAMQIDLAVKTQHLRSTIDSWNASDPYVSFGELTQAQQTVIFSRTFHQGMGMPRTAVAQDFYKAALKGHWTDAESALRSYNVSQKWYQNRVEAEANLLRTERAK